MSAKRSSRPAGAEDPGVGAAPGAEDPTGGAAAGTEDLTSGPAAGVEDPGVGAAAGAEDPTGGAAAGAEDSGVGAAAGAEDSGVGAATGVPAASGDAARPRPHSYRLSRLSLLPPLTLVPQEVLQSVVSLSLVLRRLFVLLALVVVSHVSVLLLSLALTT
ncbi:unnamed protein product [Closterium sp. Yama58-4]|nr:unnamed protein product [Closterium sp. Yama58-4]